MTTAKKHTTTGQSHHPLRYCQFYPGRRKVKVQGALVVLIVFIAAVYVVLPKAQKTAIKVMMGLEKPPSQDHLLKRPW